MIASCPHDYAPLVNARCYACVKDVAMNGGRSKLSTEELQYVGFTEIARPSDGWHSAASLAWPADEEMNELVARVRGIRYVMDIGGDRVELNA